MEYIDINKNNIYLIKEFLSAAGSSLVTFTYFAKRPIEIVLSHEKCIILKNSDLIIGYGHIEFADNKYWLGVCVVEKHMNKGYGKKIMHKLVDFCKENNIHPISLSVKKKNIIAIKLYKNIGFEICSQNEDSYFMELSCI
jgi:ribosomal protein S18 acetylase RimI-like enzyme